MAKRLVQNTSTKGDKITAELPRACADETAAVEFMEWQRWGKLPACPLCGDTNVYKMTDSKTGERQANFRWRCRGCKQQYTVRKGTVLEDSAIPLRHWCYAFWRGSTSKKGVSALEIKRQTGLSYKSALFLMHRIRKAMDTPPTVPLAGDVEVDETYIGGKPRYRDPKNRGMKRNKAAVVACVERQGRVRAYHAPTVAGDSLKLIVRSCVHPSSRILTDEHAGYKSIGKHFEGGHEYTKHSAGEYARGDVHSNTVEGFFSILKRGINGIYHAVSKEHLHRYLAEFEFRYSNRHLTDGQRTAEAIRGADGKRLMYADYVGGVK